jgi:type IV pilus assembly protein PilX
MKHPIKQFRNGAKQQRGMSLISSLIFLGVLTTLGYSSITTAFMQERMSGAWQDRKLANQAAEMALRDAEAYIASSVNGLTGFNQECNNGLCYNGPQGYAANTPADLASNVWDTSGIFGNADKTITYGQMTSAPSISGVVEQPHYLIEGFRKQQAGQGDTIFYRITVRAMGARPGTAVTLQEIYRA